MKRLVGKLESKQVMNLIGVSREEISSLETKTGLKLPEEYVCFLETMGRGAGEFMKGSSAFWNELLNLNEWGNELLAENELPPLPENAFVFWMHQGYQMAYFVIGEKVGAQKVYYFSEIKNESRTYLSIEDFFIYQYEIDNKL